MVGSSERAGPASRRGIWKRGLVTFVCCCVGLSVSAYAQAPADKRAATDHMLDALKAAPDAQSAADLENRLQNTWLRSGSPAVTLLMSRGPRLVTPPPAASPAAPFSDAITLQPDDSEAWYQRAVARYHAGDVNGAITDLEQTVRLEPRNFAAFHTLTDIAVERGDWKGAYAAWQRVMELDPKTPGGDERLQLLKRKAVGEET